MFWVNLVSQLCVHSPPNITPDDREFALHKTCVLQNTFARWQTSGKFHSNSQQYNHSFPTSYKITKLRWTYHFAVRHSAFAKELDAYSSVGFNRSPQMYSQRDSFRGVFQRILVELSGTPEYIGATSYLSRIMSLTADTSYSPSSRTFQFIAQQTKEAGTDTTSSY